MRLMARSKRRSRERKFVIGAYLIGQQEVMAGDVTFIGRAIVDALDKFKTTRELVPVCFGIGEYDSDPRELFEIPEVRDWCKKLYNLCPFVFCVLDAATIGWFFPAVAGAQVVGRDTTSKIVQVKYGPDASKLIDEIWANGKKLTQLLAESQAEFDRLAEEIGLRFRQGLRVKG